MQYFIYDTKPKYEHFLLNDTVDSLIFIASVQSFRHYCYNVAVSAPKSLHDMHVERIIISLCNVHVYGAFGKEFSLCVVDIFVGIDMFFPSGLYIWNVLYFRISRRTKKEQTNHIDEKCRIIYESRWIYYHDDVPNKEFHIVMFTSFIF